MSAFDSYVQHHQAAELAEGVIWDVADVVEGERHGLQGGQLTQSLHRHLRQRVIVQPQVTERAEAGETASGNAGDVIGIQASMERNVKILATNYVSQKFSLKQSFIAQLLTSSQPTNTVFNDMNDLERDSGLYCLN